MSERHDHGKNFSGKDRIKLCAKSFISQLYDLLARHTFGYGANGPQGLLGRKNVVVIASRGGAYEKGSARGGFDFQEPYLQHILGFIDLTDITFIHAENQTGGQALASLAAAGERIEGIIAQEGRQPVAL